MARETLNDVFTVNIKRKADAIAERYETKRASILEILRLLMEHYGYIDRERELAVADYLGLPPIDVHEVLTFYTLFYRKPKARTRLNVCRTLTCSLMGGQEIIEYIEQKLGVKAGQMTKDGQHSLEAVECLGACETAPMLQLNDDKYIGFLTREKIDHILSGQKASG